jgi:hypothetical protein
VDLLYQHIDVFTVDISIHGLRSGFLNLPYFDLSEVRIMYKWFYLLTIKVLQIHVIQYLQLPGKKLYG